MSRIVVTASWLFALGFHQQRDTLVAIALVSLPALRDINVGYGYSVGLRQAGVLNTLAPLATLTTLKEVYLMHRISAEELMTLLGSQSLKSVLFYKCDLSKIP
jgi:hypothetical protein